MSISSAEHASAQELQIAAQYIACLTASARDSLKSPATCGCLEIIFWIDKGRSSSLWKERGRPAMVPELRREGRSVGGGERHSVTRVRIGSKRDLPVLADVRGKVGDVHRHG